MTEEALKAKIRELELELEKKDLEIEQLEETIEEREDTIMKLESIKKLEEGAKKKSKKVQAAESRFAFELEEKDNYIRELKNTMGILRKDYTQLQQEFDRFKSLMTESSVIRVEDLREKPPLNALVKELQDKVNKQKSLINQLKQQTKETAELNEKIKEKEDFIESYKLEISELNQKLKDLSSTAESKNGDSIAKKLIEDLQNQLNKTKRQVIELKQKLTKYEKKSKKEQKKKVSSDVNELKVKIKELNELLDNKNVDIEKLKAEISSVSLPESTLISGHPDSVSAEMMKTLKEDLQKQLNRSKLQIKSLQEHIKKYQTGKIPEQGESQEDLEGTLKMQRDMAKLLQKQLETKEGEIETIKNEAVQIKKRYRQLESQLKSKEQKINDIQNELEDYAIRIHTQPQPKPTQREDPHLTLRIRELKNMMDDLKKENYEQRIEISELRKK